MGERALAAVQYDGHVDVYYAQWAGSDSHLLRVLDAPPGQQFEALLGANWRYRGQWRPEAFPRTVDALDIDAVYLVSARGVTVYLPVWLGFSWPSEPTTTRGVLVCVDTPEEHRRLRKLVQFLKGVLHEAIALEWVGPSTARDLLALALRTYGTRERIHTPGTPL